MKKIIIVIAVVVVLALAWYLMYGMGASKVADTKTDPAISTNDLESEAAAANFSSIEADFGAEVNAVVQ